MKGALKSRHHVVLAAAAVCAACASTAKSAGPSRPRLRSVSPDSVQLFPGNVTEIDLRGSGFDTTRAAPQNTVRIGSLVLSAVPSSGGGTVIRVAVPAEVQTGGGAPPTAWIGGRYRVVVTTPTGTSDTLTLAISALGGGRP